MLIRFKLRTADKGKLRATVLIGRKYYEGYLNGSLDELKSSFEQWQKAYLGLENVELRLTPKPQTTKVSPDDVQDLADSFKKKFNKWLQGDEKWQKVLQKLAGKFAKSSEDEIKIFLDVDEEENILRRFPWQDWDFFQENCPTKEVVLYDNVELNPVIPLADAVKVLVVIGNNEGIEQGVQEDLNALRELERKNRGVFNILEQPSPHELLSELKSKSYHIFIFTGHSKSDRNQKIGWIELSKTDSLTVSNLKYTLSEAIDGGLQLCIFNSCDGLGLAKQLIELKLPLAIVMREPVPDDVAAKFLRVFLDEFSGGQSFFQSFREARNRLEGFSLQYPGVCWLPTIYTGIEEELPTWSKLRGQYIESKPPINPHSKKIWRQWSFLAGVAFTSIAAFIAIWVIRDGEPINPHPELFSLGDKNLTPVEAWKNKNLRKCLANLNSKNQAIQRFNEKNFEEAKGHFQKFIQYCPSDPEARIYLNNADAALQGHPIQIAVSVPIGHLIGVAQEMLRGVAQVQEQVNQEGGINGRLLQVLIANDDTSEDTNLVDKATIVAQTLTQKREILGVIGHYSSDATSEAGQEYNLDDLVLIAPTSTAVRQQIQFTDNVFRTSPTDAVATKDLVNHLLEKDFRKAAIIYESNSEYSKSLRQLLIDHSDWSNTISIAHGCNLSSPDFSASKCVEDAFDKGAEILALFPSSQLSNEIQTLISQNYNLPFSGRQFLPLLAGDAIYGDKILREFGREVEGMVVAIPWHHELKNSASVTFLKEAQKLWGTQSVNWRTASSYDATQALVEGLKQLGKNPTRKGLKQILSQGDFSAQGATGLVEFDGGDRKITSKNENELGILVQVQCDYNYDNCTFVPLDR